MFYNRALNPKPIFCVCICCYYIFTFFDFTFVGVASHFILFGLCVTKKRGTLFTRTWMIEPLMQTRPILIYSATLRPPTTQTDTGLGLPILSANTRKVSSVPTIHHLQTETHRLIRQNVSCI